MEYDINFVYGFCSKMCVFKAPLIFLNLKTIYEAIILVKNSSFHSKSLICYLFLFIYLTQLLNIVHSKAYF